MNGGERLPWISRPVGAAALTALGSVLVAVHGFHLVSMEMDTLEQLTGVAVPILLALVVTAAGPLLYRSRLDAAAIRTTVVWGYLGAAAISLVTLLVVVHQSLEGEPVHGPTYVIAATATGGALVGTVTGRYDALNRQKADLVGSLQEATAKLAAATTTEQVCDRAVEIANEVLDIRIAGIWLYDEEAEALVPQSLTDPAKPKFDSPPTFRPGNSLSWEAFETGDIRRFDDVREVPGTYNSDSTIRSEIIVPLGDMGVINFGSFTPGQFDSLDETVAELLGSATEAALVRAEREETLRTQRRMLQRQNDRLEEFTSVVSHDLRNPLSVARGRVELAREATESEHLDAASTALDDMETLIDDLLELAKQGQTVGDTERISLSAVAEAAWRNFDVDGATLEIDDADVDADRDRLRQLLENLFSNALDHAGPNPELRVGPLPDADGIFVEDDGPGIDPEERDRIFGIGYTNREDGTGFGLSIVRRIADAHGWSISVTEGEDGGARFEFRFDAEDGSRS